MPVVSIIVPIYNIEEHLPQCINSISSQTYQDLEIILVNDGSTDNSGLICDELALSDKRIRVIHQHNGGASNARNTGIREAKGEYICFVDGDDVIHTSMVESLVSFARRDRDVDIVACQLQIFKGDFDFAQATQRRNIQTFLGNEALAQLLYQKIINGPVAKLFKKSLFNGVMFPLGVKVGEDLLTNILVFHRSSRVILLDQALYGYFSRRGSAMNTASIADRMLLIKKLEDQLKSGDFLDPIKRALGSRIFTEAVYVSVELSGNSTEEYLTEREDFKETIRRYRKSVVTNSEINWFYRLLASLSYVSYLLPGRVFILRRDTSAFLKRFIPSLTSSSGFSGSSRSRRLLNK